VICLCNASPPPNPTKKKHSLDHNHQLTKPSNSTQKQSSKSIKYDLKRQSNSNPNKKRQSSNKMIIAIQQQEGVKHKAIRNPRSADTEQIKLGKTK